MKFATIFFVLLFSAFSYCQPLPGFIENSDGEQVYSFRYDPEISVLINAPAPEKMDKYKPAGIILYALPNGNTTAQTIGKILEPGDDWHFGIQNIGAQTRFLRETIKEYNVITVYLETDQKSWPAWKSVHSDYALVIKHLTEKIMNTFSAYNPFIILSGHSGGGRFIFSFLDAYEKIPSFVKRICFIDSNYGYETSYGTRIAEWLKQSDENFLCVLAYNDSNVVLNGKNIVSPTGGTWYRSKMMKGDLSSYFSFIEKEDEHFISYTGEAGKIKIILKKNPDNEIFHTVQVERNGFIHSVLEGTAYENRNYTYFGERAY